MLIEEAVRIRFAVHVPSTDQVVEVRAQLHNSCASGILAGSVFFCAISRNFESTGRRVLISFQLCGQRRSNNLQPFSANNDLISHLLIHVRPARIVDDTFNSMNSLST